VLSIPVVAFALALAVILLVVPLVWPF